MKPTASIRPYITPHVQRRLLSPPRHASLRARSPSPQRALTPLPSFTGRLYNSSLATASTSSSDAEASILHGKLNDSHYGEGVPFLLMVEPSLLIPLSRNINADAAVRSAYRSWHPQTRRSPDAHHTEAAGPARCPYLLHSPASPSTVYPVLHRMSS